MRTMFRQVILGTALAATALSAAAPAEAQRYRRHGRGGGDAATGAIIGGIVGLGLGAAIAGNNRRYRDRGYDGYYARPRGFGGYGYNGYNGYNGYRGYDGYYDGPRGYAYDGYYDDRPRCWTRFRYDPYYGDRVPVRVCN